MPFPTRTLSKATGPSLDTSKGSTSRQPRVLKLRSCMRKPGLPSVSKFEYMKKKRARHKRKYSIKVKMESFVKDHTHTATNLYRNEYQGNFSLKHRTIYNTKLDIKLTGSTVFLWPQSNKLNSYSIYRYKSEEFSAFPTFIHTFPNISVVFVYIVVDNPVYHLSCTYVCNTTNLYLSMV